MIQKKQNRFLKLYEPVHANFERFCRARTYGDMNYKDLINETLLKAFEKLDDLRSEESFLSFLFSIAIRILANYNRKKKESSDDLQKTKYLHMDSQIKTETDTEVYLLHKALKMLPENHRECVILFEISGMSIKEIASIQETSESNVKQRLKRGREKLKIVLTFESKHKVGEMAI